MKQAALLILASVFMLSTFAQYAGTPASPINNDLYKKSKNQKKAAWILLGGGAGLTTVGLIIGLNSAANELVDLFNTGQNDKSFTTGAVFFYTGIAAMAGCIPLFIAR